MVKQNNWWWKAKITIWLVRNLKYHGTLRVSYRQTRHLLGFLGRYSACGFLYFYLSLTSFQVIFCIWRNRLFHLGLVPKSSGIKYMVDANNGHPNIYSISIFGGWIFSGTTYSTVIVGSRKNAKAHPFPHDWHQLALQWPKNISNKSTLQHI